MRSTTMVITIRQIHSTVPDWMVPEATEREKAYYG